MGERTQETLARLAIHTVADLAHTPPPALYRLVGAASGQRLLDLAWGRDPRAVEPVRQEKSIGHEQTFFTDLTDLADLSAVLLDQSHRCAARLRAAELVTSGVSIKVRLADFTTLTRSHPLDAATDVAHDIYMAARSLLAGMTLPPGGVRLLGVRCDALSDSATTAVQATLDDPGTERRDAERTMDVVRARYGASALTAGSLIGTPATAKGKSDIS